MPTPTLPEEAFVTRLKGWAAFTAIVGQRLWPDVSNQDPTFPFTLYGRQGANRLQSLTATKGLARYQITLDAFAATAAQQQAIVKAATDALDGWSDPTLGVKGCFVEPAESVEQDVAGDVYRSMSLVATLWFRAP